MGVLAAVIEGIKTQHSKLFHQATQHGVNKELHHFYESVSRKLSVVSGFTPYPSRLTPHGLIYFPMIGSKSFLVCSGIIVLSVMRAYCSAVEQTQAL